MVKSSCSSCSAMACNKLLCRTQNKGPFCDFSGSSWRGGDTGGRLVEHWWFSVPSSELPAFPLVCAALVSLTTLHVCWMQSTLAVGAGMTGQGARDSTDREAPSGKPWVSEPEQGLFHSSSPSVQPSVTPSTQARPMVGSYSYFGCFCTLWGQPRTQPCHCEGGVSLSSAGVSRVTPV